MFNTPIKKAWRDLWRHKLRSTMAACAIALSTAILGTILIAFHYLSRDMNGGFLSASPHHVSVEVGEWKPGALATLRQHPSVQGAEARSVLRGRAQNSAGDWKQAVIFGSPDWTDNDVDQVAPEEGPWPTARGAVSIERQALSVLDGSVGDELVFEVDGIASRPLKVAGVVHDVVQAQAQWESLVYAYTDLETLTAAGLDASINRLLISFTEVETRDDAVAQWQTVRPLLEAQGIEVGWATIPTPGRHPHDAFTRQMFMILKAAAWASSFFAGLLLVNLMSISLTAERRQAGVLRTIGARWSQVARLYAASVLMLAGVGALAGMTLVLPAAWAFAGWLAERLNINLTSVAFPPWILLTLILVGVVIPLVATLWPIWQLSRRSIRASLVDYGLADTHRDQRSGKRAVSSALSVPIALALRNLLRRRGRFVLNLVVLTGAGAMMMTAFNYDAVMSRYVDTMRNNNQWDRFFIVAEPMDVKAIGRLSELPEIESAVPQFRTAGKVAELENLEVSITGIAPDSDMFAFTFHRGRWLEKSDEAVINEALWNQLSPDTTHLTVATDEGEHRFRIAGVAAIFGGPRMLVSDAWFADRGISKTNRVLVKLSEPANDPEDVLSTALTPNRVSFITTVEGSVKGVIDHFVIIFRTIAALATLIALIAVSGVFSSTSMSLLERTREIAILKAIGCTRTNLTRMLVAEGVMLGIPAWVLSLLLSLPLTILVANVSGQIFLKTPMAFAVSQSGYLLCLVVLPALSAAACWIPAYAAARRPIRSGLVYE